MRVAITGASGLIGTATSAALRARGDEVTPVSRRAKPGGIQWDPLAGFDPPERLSGYDAVINLAGESIAGRWTATKKERIMASRIAATKAVVAAFRAAEPRPRILINASATGIYGDRGDERLDEDSSLGPEGEFLCDVARAWEGAAREVEALEGPSVRLCLARFGVVLDREGGALGKMMTPFKLGAGGKIGSGRQWMPWVHVEDAVAALLFLLDHAETRGAYNLVAPSPVRNLEFTRGLGKALHRPTLLPLPKFGVKLALGEMGEALLLDGQRAVPKRLVDAGFEFSFAELDAAFASLLD